MAKEEKYGVGTIHENKKGLKFEIIEKIDSKRRKIKFLDSGFENIKTLSSLNSKSCEDCSHYIKNGDVFVTKEGYSLIVIDYVDSKNIWVKFKNQESPILKTVGKELKEGAISNPYHRSVLNLGYFGVGDYMSYKDDKFTPEYKSWASMLRRCYDKSMVEKNPTYKNVTVCEEWHNFQNFAKWHEENYPKHLENMKLSLDKDLLQMGVRNKIYSPETCCFLPSSINTFLATNNLNRRNTSGYTGVSYSKSKNKWKSQITDFGTGKKIYIGNFDSKEEASSAYKKYKYKNVEKAKDYLRNLNYLPEHIIQLIK